MFRPITLGNLSFLSDFELLLAVFKPLKGIRPIQHGFIVPRHWPKLI